MFLLILVDVGLDWMGRLHQFQSAQVAIPVTIKEILLTKETNLKFYGLLRGCESNFKRGPLNHSMQCTKKQTNKCKIKQ